MPPCSRLPHSRGGPPRAASWPAPFNRFAPNTWVVGSTFEYEFDFPVIAHKLYDSAKPDESKKRHTLQSAGQLKPNRSRSRSVWRSARSRAWNSRQNSVKNGAEPTQQPYVSTAKSSASAGIARTLLPLAKPAAQTAPRNIGNPENHDGWQQSPEPAQALPGPQDDTGIILLIIPR